jgi:DNA-binding MarR family transcriptional regulator
MAQRPKATFRRRANPADPAFEIAGSPFYWLARTTARYELSMDSVLKRIGMDVPRWRVLMLLEEHSPASVSALAEHAIARLSTMTKLVLRMKGEGYVETRVSERDGRVTEVLLTQKGHDALDHVRIYAGRIFEQAFRDVDDGRIDDLNRLMQDILRNLDNRPD